MANLLAIIQKSPFCSQGLTTAIYSFQYVQKNPTKRLTFTYTGLHLFGTAVFETRHREWVL